MSRAYMASLLAMAFLPGSHPVAFADARPLREAPRSLAFGKPTRRREESDRRLAAASAKRERRRQRRLELAADAREGAICTVAVTVELARLSRERYPGAYYYDTAERLVDELLADHRWTAERICRDPIAAVRAWGGR